MAEHSPSNGESSGGPCTLAVRNGVATVTLNRPEIHNAFDETLIATLTETFVTLDDDRDVRVVVLAGAGRSFCAGDLNWMSGWPRRRRREPATRRRRRDAARAVCVVEADDRACTAPRTGGGVGLIAGATSRSPCPRRRSR